MWWVCLRVPCYATPFPPQLFRYLRAVLVGGRDRRRPRTPEAESARGEGVRVIGRIDVVGVLARSLLRYPLSSAAVSLLARGACRRPRAPAAEDARGRERQRPRAPEAESARGRGR